MPSEMTNEAAPTNSRTGAQVLVESSVFGSAPLANNDEGGSAVKRCIHFLYRIDGKD